MKKIMLGCALGLSCLVAHAQDEAAPAESEPAAAAGPQGNAWTALENRWFVSPSLSYVFADTGRETDDGFGGTFSAGRRYLEDFAFELFVQYNRFDHEQGSGTAKLLGAGANMLYFPTKKVPAYLLMGAGYGDVKSQPGNDRSYGTALLNVGGGYWFQPFDLGFLKGVSLRTDAVMRFDAHSDRRTGADVDNGRKTLGDVVLSIGLTIPIGEPAPPPPPPPVEVVAVETPPEAPAAAGAAPAATCKSPEPGEKLDLSGCGSGDVVVLKGVNFETAKDRLTPNAKTILDGVAEALTTASTTNVELGGHTDARGADDYNQHLSDRRACSVGKYLAGKGIDASRMTPAGYGETKPIADNETDEGRELNRRVELKILDGAGAGLGACGASASAPRAAAASEAAPAAVESAPAEAAPAEAAPTESTPAEAAPSEAAPAAEAPASTSEPAPEPAAAAPAEMPLPEPAGSQPAPATSEAPAASAKPMEMVPEGEVFDGASKPAEAPSTEAPKSDEMKMVPEKEVFGGS